MLATFETPGSRGRVSFRCQEIECVWQKEGATYLGLQNRPKPVEIEHTVEEATEIINTALHKFYTFTTSKTTITLNPPQS